MAGREQQKRQLMRLTLANSPDITYVCSVEDIVNGFGRSEEGSEDKKDEGGL